MEKHQFLFQSHQHFPRKIAVIDWAMILWRKKELMICTGCDDAVMYSRVWRVVPAADGICLGGVWWRMRRPLQCSALPQSRRDTSTTTTAAPHKKLVPFDVGEKVKK